MKKSKLLFSAAFLIAPFLFIARNETATDKLNHVDRFSVDADCGSLNGIEKVVCLANAFKATLDANQVASLQLPYNRENAILWSNFPEFKPLRVGVKMGSLNAAQWAAARALMASVLVDGIANEGLNELEGAMAADDYLGARNGNSIFTSANYFLAFLGTPSTTGLWELQFGGHHFAFANTYNSGLLKGATPSFRGIEPMPAFTQNGKTFQPLEQERKAFAELLAALNPTEQLTARLSDKFQDIELGPNQDGKFPKTKQGLRVGSLSGEKQNLVVNAIKLYVEDLDPVTAKSIMDKYKSELADTRIAFSGNVTMDKERDYIRIDGPNVWIEYSAQPSRDVAGEVHPHSVWRDRTGDYGGN